MIFVPRVSTKIGPFNVGVSAYPNRRQDPRQAYMANDRRTQRPRQATPRQAARDSRQALAEHQRVAAFQAYHARQASQTPVFFAPTPATPVNVPVNPWHVRPAEIHPYSQPSTHRAKVQPAQRPTTRRPFGHYLCVMLALVLGALVSIMVLGMLGMALGLAPATQGSDTTPHATATTTTHAAHTGVHTPGGAAHK